VIFGSKRGRNDGFPRDMDSGERLSGRNALLPACVAASDNFIRGLASSSSQVAATGLFKPDTAVARMWARIAEPETRVCSEAISLAAGSARGPGCGPAHSDHEAR
jgi:hypothetical protein